MRSSSFLIAGSLCANVALAAVLFLRTSNISSSSADPSVEARVETRSAKSTGSTADVDPATWNHLYSTEPTGFVARLRADGFPLSIIRAMARQQVNEHFAARHQAIAKVEAEKAFWVSEGRVARDAQLNAERRALGRDTQAMLQQLLGADALQPTPDQLVALQQRFGNLPGAKLSQIQSITADYNDLSRQVSDVADGILFPQDRATLALLQKEREADIARLLSPEELVEYELHHSTTANRLLAQISAFDATEEEFRALFALNRAVDAAHGNPGVLTPEQRRARADALKELTPKIEAVLGPQRFTEYQQAIDPNYQQAFQLVTRLELPKTTAAEIVALQKETEQRGTALRADRSLNLQQRQAQFAALHDEATRKLASTLGQRGLDAYKASGGSWLQSLQLQATTRAAPKDSAP